MKDQVIDFIQRRFPEDSNWLDGNCYFFALILKNRFNGTILYDVIFGHFVTRVDDKLYDWSGVVTDPESSYVEWDKFDEYDKLQKESIIRGCIN